MNTGTSQKRKILLIVAGGIAAYKIPELIRRLREDNITVQCILTEAGSHFITPLTLGSVSNTPVYQDIFSLKDEVEMGHIHLSRVVDIVVVAPATADLLAKMAHGLANDLASGILLATNRPILIAPAMNGQMWNNPATQANIASLEERGVQRVGPTYGMLACGEEDEGRMIDISDLVSAINVLLIESTLHTSPTSLTGLHVLVTSGPTYEAIDPVRYITNHSSGRQGHAIATVIARRGARVTLISGPTNLPDPINVRVIHVKNAREMLSACEATLPVEVAICTAAVSDWRTEYTHPHKLKKSESPDLLFTLNPDILATLGYPGPQRPSLVIGFAAETESLLTYASQKRIVKGCDWIVVNDVSAGANTFGGHINTVHLVTETGIVSWPTMTKFEVAEVLADRIIEVFRTKDIGMFSG